MNNYINKFCALVGFAFLMIAMPAQAHHGRHHHHHNFHNHHPHWQHRHWHPQHGWVVPAIVGGVVTYEIMRRNRPVIVEREIMEVPAAPPIIDNTRCTEWREIQTNDGRVYRERNCRSE